METSPHPRITDARAYALVLRARGITTDVRAIRAIMRRFPTLEACEARAAWGGGTPGLWCLSGNPFSQERSDPVFKPWTSPTRTP